MALVVAFRAGPAGLFARGPAQGARGRADFDISRRRSARGEQRRGTQIELRRPECSGTSHSAGARSLPPHGERVSLRRLARTLKFGDGRDRHDAVGH
jgi:hypothetical protein